MTTEQKELAAKFKYIGYVDVPDWGVYQKIGLDVIANKLEIIEAEYIDEWKKNSGHYDIKIELCNKDFKEWSTMSHGFDLTVNFDGTVNVKKWDCDNFDGKRRGVTWKAVLSGFTDIDLISSYINNKFRVEMEYLYEMELKAEDEARIQVISKNIIKSQM